MKIVAMTPCIGFMARTKNARIPIQIGSSNCNYNKRYTHILCYSTLKLNGFLHERAEPGVGEFGARKDAIVEFADFVHERGLEEEHGK